MIHSHTYENPSFGNGPFGTNPLSIPSAPSPTWSCSQLEEQYMQSLANYRCGSAHRPPPTPQEIVDLVETGKWETAVRRLDFIFSYRLLEQRWNDLYPCVAARVSDQLQEAAERPETLSLSPAEHAVSQMLYLLATEGLDSFHPSPRAIDLVRKHAHALDHDLDSRFYKGGKLSYRVRGAASLLSAEASLPEELQPCGIAVLEAARSRNIPRIMFPSHHAVGGDAVELIADFCTRHGILGGNISCDRMVYDMPQPDIFLISKDEPENWRRPMTALCELASGHSGDILIVEDELHPCNQNGQPVDVEAIITAVRGELPCTLHFARDYTEALDIMNSHLIAAVGSDLYIPEKAGTCARGGLTDLRHKDLGNRLVHRVLDEFLAKETVEELLLEARRLEMTIYQSMRSELHKIVTL